MTPSDASLPPLALGRTSHRPFAAMILLSAVYELDGKHWRGPKRSGFAPPLPEEATRGFPLGWSFLSSAPPEPAGSGARLAPQLAWLAPYYATLAGLNPGIWSKDGSNSSSPNA